MISLFYTPGLIFAHTQTQTHTHTSRIARKKEFTKKPLNERISLKNQSVWHTSIMSTQLH